MIKRRLFILALAIGTLSVARPHKADAVDTLFVTAYYSDIAKKHLVGQWWHGCGQPSGHWGIQTEDSTLHFTPCN